MECQQVKENVIDATVSFDLITAYIFVFLIISIRWRQIAKLQ